MSSGTRASKKGFANPIGSGIAEAAWSEQGPTSYTTGGYQINAASGTTVLNAGLGLRGLITGAMGVDGTGTYMVVAYPTSNSSRPVATLNVKWFTLSGMTEVSNATNLSTFFVSLRALGG